MTTVADRLSVEEAPREQTSGQVHRRSVPAGAVDWMRIVQILALVLLPCACYWPALDGEFLWDDDLLITKNPLLQSAEGLRQIWVSTIPYDYFPLTNTSFWAEWRLWGAEPLGYHLVNLGLHVASAFLLWRLLKVLRVPGAWFGALLFVIHPINVASVAWISERKNTLSMAFYLGCLVCYARADQCRDGRAAWKPYLAALGLFVLAVLSKSSVVMLPCVLLLFGWWQRGRLGWRDAVRTVPFFAVSFAAGLLTIWFQYHRTMSAETLAHANPLPVRILTAGLALWFYLGKILYPQPLAMLYPRWEVGVGDSSGYVALAGLAALLIAAWWGRRFWGRGVVAALGYFVLMALPVSGLLHMSFFTYGNVSDHLVYVAAPGIIVLAAAVFAHWYARGGGAGKAALVVMAGVTGLLCLGCLLRAEEFSSSERLWTATLAVDPRCFAAHNNIGLVYQERGHHDPFQLLRAEAHFREALKIDYKLESAGVNLANVLRMQGRWKQSADLYRKVLDVHPEPESFNNYGVALLELGDNTTARGAFVNALRLDPTMTNAYYNLYGIELAEHHLPAACAMLRACLRIDPDNVQALMALVTLNVDQPDQPPLSVPAAEVMVAVAERACALTRFRAAQPLTILSKSLLAAGRKPEAIAVAARARTAALDEKDEGTAQAIAAFQRTLGQ